jgi:hypothetical protein
MYGATAVAELDRAHVAPSDQEGLSLADQLLTAVSAGWSQVMDLVDSWALDEETRRILSELKKD